MQQGTDWRALSHAEFVATLTEALDERERRIAEMQALMGAPQLPGMGSEPARRGRAPKHDLSTRAGQLAAAAESGEGVQ